ncbi:MAG: hypothetical protein ACYCPK_02745, partial [Acidimicrobiales bacterium]
ARGVEGEPAQESPVLVENPDVEIGDEGDDATPGVAASDREVAEGAAVAQGDRAVGRDPVVADPSVKS